MSSPHTFTNWTKSSRSSGGDNCVEVAFDEDGNVGVRHSKDPDGPVLKFTAAEYAAYVAGVVDGELRGA
jgi:Domain of unknown function (DUF397)